MLRVITYPTNDEVIAKLRTECADLTPDTPKGYEEVRVAIGNLRTLRVSVEDRRKELKAGALDYGRKVDAEAKRLTEAIEAIETPLRDKKQAVDDEKARARPPRKRPSSKRCARRSRPERGAAGRGAEGGAGGGGSPLADERARARR
jgi:hypothetical protein